mmetsp:Transcript_24150/g.63687  ORF Transcript_24150/g.63687 Transcript_24150/m.63687 type:complete len:221 (+) Transcript_24150:1128-1790(+)
MDIGKAFAGQLERLGIDWLRKLAQDGPFALVARFAAQEGGERLRGVRLAQRRVVEVVAAFEDLISPPHARVNDLADEVALPRADATANVAHLAVRPQRELLRAARSHGVEQVHPVLLAGDRVDFGGLEALAVGAELQIGAQALDHDYVALGVQLVQDVWRRFEEWRFLHGDLRRAEEQGSHATVQTNDDEHVDVEQERVEREREEHERSQIQRVVDGAPV